MSILDAIVKFGVGSSIMREADQKPRCANMETLRNMTKEDANATDWTRATQESKEL